MFQIFKKRQSKAQKQAAVSFDSFISSVVLGNRYRKGECSIVRFDNCEIFEGCYVDGRRIIGVLKRCDNYYSYQIYAANDCEHIKRGVMLMIDASLISVGQGCGDVSFEVL